MKSGNDVNPPKPDPIPTPTVKTLKQLSTDLANKVQTTNRVQEAKTIASNFRVIAAQITASDLTPEKIAELVRVTNRGTLKDDLMVKWKAWQDGVAKELSNMSEAGKLVTAKQHADAYTQIAESLETGINP